MLKIGKASLKGLWLTSWLVGLYLLAQPSLATTRLKAPDKGAFLLPDHCLQSSARNQALAPGQLSQPLREKLHQWLRGQIGQESLEDFVLNSQAILDSPGFDLYLLELWLEAGRSRPWLFSITN